jgi:hypothetical protein
MNIYNLFIGMDVSKLKLDTVCFKNHRFKAIIPLCG